MKVRNPFHRASEAERHQKNINALKSEKTSLKGEVRRNRREIAKCEAQKRDATRRGDFKEAKAAIIERKRLESHGTQLEASGQMVSEATRTVRHVQTQAVINTSINKAFRTVEKSVKSGTNNDQTMERWEKMREFMDERMDQTDDMLNNVAIDVAAEQEADEEIRALAASMGQTTVQPVGQNTAPVYEDAEALEEEV